MPTLVETLPSPPADGNGETRSLCVPMGRAAGAGPAHRGKATKPEGWLISSAGAEILRVIEGDGAESIVPGCAGIAATARVL